VSARTIQILSPLLIAYAVCGLVLSVAAHLLAIIGLPPNIDGFVIGLFVGVFPFWVPVTYIVMKLAHGASNKDFWKILHSGCPAWMSHADRVLYWYAGANFVVVVLASFFYPVLLQSTGVAPRAFWILASSYCMLFYFAGLCAITTAYRKGIERKCSNGHVVGVGDKFCPTCGTSLNTDTLWASPT
jgi:hypothetical protein